MLAYEGDESESKPFVLAERHIFAWRGLLKPARERHQLLCGVVRCGRGVVYLKYFGLQLGKACYPCSR